MEQNNYEYTVADDTKIAILWNGMEKHLPDSFEMVALGKYKVFVAFKLMYPMINELIHTALKEQEATFLNQKANAHDQAVRKLLAEQILKEMPQELKEMDILPSITNAMVRGHNQCLSECKECVKKYI
jgi:hypothetical protein